MSGSISALVLNELRVPVAEPVKAAAAAVRARHGDAVLAVLFYGSCLREESDVGKVVDFYVLVDRYGHFHSGAVMAALNAALPPNVYYMEAPYEGRAVRVKYAVYSLTDFARGASPGTLQSTIWARFAQPSALLYSREKWVETRIVSILTICIGSAVEAILPLMPETFTSGDFWKRVFAVSYGSELRAEGEDRPALLYERFAARYDELSRMLLTPAGTRERYLNTASSWRRTVAVWRNRLRRIEGKTLNLLRLVKAAFTFEGSLDYILWKVERHSGVHVAPSAWQRRHPVLAAPGLAWRLYRAGAFR